MKYMVILRFVSFGEGGDRKIVEAMESLQSQVQEHESQLNSMRQQVSKHVLGNPEKLQLVQGP